MFRALGPLPSRASILFPNVKSLCPLGELSVPASGCDHSGPGSPLAKMGSGLGLTIDIPPQPKEPATINVLPVKTIGTENDLQLIH